MKRLLIPFAAALALAACDDPADEDGLRIRIENASTIAFEDVLVGFESDTLEIGPLAPGALTGYRRLDAPQQLTLVSLMADGVLHTMEPAPGSTLLDDDDFTFVLGLDTDGGGIQLEILEDD
ncbi:MAG TPA: hypothetical protein VF039_09095 [Longimicrobiales bacterium]